MTPEVERFGALVARHLGLVLDAGRHDLLAEVLHRRAGKTGVGIFLQGLENPASRDWRLLAQDLTVTETSFFRDAGQMRIFAEVALPAAARSQPLRILSAGCASGEELHSLSILIRESPALAGREICLKGVDVNAAMLKKAAAGRYSAWSLRQVPPDIQARWFRAEGRDFILDESIRAMAGFSEHNLVPENAELWRPGSYDIVFCRNVLMYFSPETMRGIVARIAASLVPGGFLFLGHAESLRGLSEDFNLHHAHGAFYYQRKSAPVCEAAPRESVAVQRIVAPRPAPPPPTPCLDMGAAIALLAAENFSQVQILFDALPPALADTSEALLLAAILAAQAGDLVRALALCARLIARNENGPGAHYLAALACESGGDAPGAVRHNRAATVLDPAFAMARLHLGLLARRAGRRDEAGRELRQALPLLAREDAGRLVLYGGGFSRAALLNLCRAELEAL